MRPPISGNEPRAETRRQTVLEREFRGVFGQQTALHDDRASPLLVHSRECLINLIGSVHHYSGHDLLPYASQYL